MMYYRYSNADTAISNYTGFGMFSRNENRVSACYGQNRFTYDGSDGIEIEAMKERFVDAWENFSDCAPDYMQQMTADEFFQAFNPTDIVEDAEAWDNSDFRRFFCDYIYNDESAILLDDGAIVFDEALTKKSE